MEDIIVELESWKILEIQKLNTLIITTNKGTIKILSHFSEHIILNKRSIINTLPHKSLPLFSLGGEVKHLIDKEMNLILYHSTSPTWNFHLYKYAHGKNV